MYKEIIGLSFSEMVEKFPDIKMSDKISKVITLTNREDIDTYSNKSDILLFYDTINGKLLTIAERVRRQDYEADQEVRGSVEQAAEAFNNQNTEYVATALLSEDFVDISVVHKRLATVE